MKKQSVYIDTSVIGGCFDKEFDKWSNSLIEDFKNRIYIPVVSEVIAAEIDSAPNYVKEKYNEILEIDAINLNISEEVIILAEKYQERKILISKFFDDGLHIALATVHQIDLVVSWNFKHIVHFDKIRQFNAVNSEFGYKNIEIYSPREVATYESD
jgi:hypothetical protein